MADDLSLNMILRLRGNANACNRSAEQNRRALQQNLSDSDASQPEAPPPPAPPARPASPQPQAAAPAAMTQGHQAMWAAAMATVAEEYAAALPTLPPEEREQATLRANALNYCINEFRSGVEPPPPDPARTPPPRR